MAVQFQNTAFSASQSSTGLLLGNSFLGTSLLSGVTPVTINGTIDRPGSPVSVNLNLAGVTYVGASGSYLGYSTTPANDFVYYFAVQGAGLTTPVTVGVTGAAALPALNVLTPITTTNVTAPVGPSTPCFVTGTLIQTSEGERPVEEIRAGDLVLTAAGEARPVRWVGHRRVACTSHPRPRAVWPVKIVAGAFGQGLPQRDLWVSPDHAICVDAGTEVLIPAKHLLNGATIVQVPVGWVTYWHVELDSHDILLAEGLPAESFLDTGVRGGFENGAAHAVLHPDFAALTHDDFCRPLVQDGPILRRVRAGLAEVAATLGWRITRDPGLHLRVDGTVVRPAIDGDVVSFALPAGASRVELVSRSFVPSALNPDAGDERRLGVPLRSLQIEAADQVRRIASGAPDFAAGFSFPQGTGADGWRWTDGAALLPAGLWDGLDGPVRLRVTLVPAEHWAADGVYAVNAASPAEHAIARAA